MLSYMKEDDTSIPMILCVVYYISFPELILHRIVISNTASSKRNYTQHVVLMIMVGSPLKLNERSSKLGSLLFLRQNLHNIIVCQVACC